MLTLFLQSSELFAWSAPAHQVIAQIAYDNLNSETRDQVDQWLAPESFIMASVWADRIKGQDIHAFDDWHFINQPFSPDGSSPDHAINKQNVVWAIKQSQRVLQSRRAPFQQKAMFLRFLIHFVGDVHQPLHCVSRVTKAHPEGDFGGNLYNIRYPHAKSLHQLWDKSLGLFDAFYQTRGAKKKRLIKEWARELQHAYPPDKLQTKVRDLHPEHWAQESFSLAKTFVYNTPEYGAPSAAYLKKGREIAGQQIALAGYRLAGVLNENARISRDNGMDFSG